MIRKRKMKKNGLDKKVMHFVEWIKSHLIDFPFSEYQCSEPLSEQNFLKFLYPFLKETIEDEFCAKAYFNEEMALIVQFDSGENFEVRLLCNPHRF